MPDQVYIGVDIIWGHCPRTRRSTCGGLKFWAIHLLGSDCQKQRTIALGIDEAQVHDFVNAMAQNLFVRNVLQSMTAVVKKKVTVGADSGAALGITHRVGTDRARHTETSQIAQATFSEAVRDKAQRGSAKDN